MKKISVPISNDYCPQTLFLYGTYKEDDTPDFGLFCWFSYIWLGDSMGVMACIGGDKLTKDRIFETGIFSANLVTEPLLPVADYLGSVSGYDADKMDIDLAIEPGQKLHVPTLSDSPVTFELKVYKHIPLDDSDVFLCEVVNTLMPDETGTAKNAKDKYELLQKYAPICTTNATYHSFDGRFLGEWGTFVSQIKH